jgi:membrane protease YdiL (CAAX protease family)
LNISKETKIQIKYLIIPIIWQLIYLIFSGSFDKTHRVYCDLIFYLGISVYFIALGSISFKKLWNEWKKGKKFWLPVFFTLISITIAFGIGSLVSMLFPNVNDGMGTFRVVNLPTLLAFAVTTILLPPIAEEAFYRKGILNFDNNISLLLTSVVGALLYASEHSLKPLGLLIATIWAVPFTISYIKTKNIYISMTAHFICNLLFKGVTVVLISVKFLGI